MEMIALGLLELNSITRGIVCADAMLKAAEVRLLLARPVCPGKYIVLVSGEVAAVRSASDAGAAQAEGFLVDRILIPNLHPQVAEAICACSPASEPRSLGIMEFFSMASAVVAADTAVKTSDVRLIEVRLGVGIGGKSYVTLSGEVAAAQAAVDAGTRVAREQGMLVTSCVIAAPRPEIFESLS